METMFAWMIEAPGPHYLRTRKVPGPSFTWTKDPNEGLRFASKEQADGVLMAVRELEPELFDFEKNLGNAWPVEHGWHGEHAPAEESER